MNHLMKALDKKKAKKMPGYETNERDFGKQLGDDLKRSDDKSGGHLAKTIRRIKSGHYSK